MPIQHKILLFTSLVIAGWLVGCGQANKYAPPPPPTVTVAEPLRETVTEYLEFTGTTRAFKDVEVRARVRGILESMHFEPGTQVDQGDLLFVIDPREYEAHLNAAKAEVRSAEAQVERAKIELGRAERLYKQKAGSEADVVKWRGERDIALAAIMQAEAKVERAALDLSYTQVTAPISGRVSRNLVDPGNLVGEGEPTLLTTVTDFDPMYVYFNLNELDLLRAREVYRENVEKKGLDPAHDSTKKAEIPLQLGLADEEGYPHEGIADFSESGVDPETGTLQLRGLLPNPGKVKKLLPGLFGRVRMPIQEKPNALLVTERAIGSDQSGRYILVVNTENVVEKRSIRQGQLVDGMRVIEEGLRAGEPVIVKGVQRARSGAKVNPEQIDMASLTTSALRAAAEEEKIAADSGATATTDKGAGEPAGRRESPPVGEPAAKTAPATAEQAE